MNIESLVIDEILNGHTEKYRIFVDRYSPMVFYIVRRFIKNDEDEVKELSQQIFVNAYERLSSFKKDSKFSSWLHVIAMNHCRDYIKDIRRTNKRFSEMDQDFLENSFNETSTPYMGIEAKELENLLEQAVKKLAKEYSEPFLLKYRDGLSYDVISERLGISVSALKVRAHRARRELRSYIERQVK